MRAAVCIVGDALALVAAYIAVRAIGDGRWFLFLGVIVVAVALFVVATGFLIAPSSPRGEEDAIVRR